MNNDTVNSIYLRCDYHSIFAVDCAGIHISFVGLAVGLPAACHKETHTTLHRGNNQ